VRVSDRAARMCLNPSTIVGILDRLESRGLVQRNRSDDDRGVARVLLTDIGEEFLAGAPEAASGLPVNGPLSL